MASSCRASIRSLQLGTILEIAPGFGRWSQYLKELCDELILVDLTESCIEHCRARFEGSTHISYHVNDGRSLAMIPDASVDLVFSFDSLVHADESVLEAYLKQIAAKLTPDGVGFVHHSNAGVYKGMAELTRRMPGPLRARLLRRGLAFDVGAWRAEDVRAEKVLEIASAAGLHAISQERMAWQHGRFLMDAITTFTLPGSRRAAAFAEAQNPRTSTEASRIRRLYARGRRP